MADATDSSSSESGNANPWLIAALVSVATFMEVLDTTIANVALRYISGGLAVSSDEASWVVTEPHSRDSAIHSSIPASVSKLSVARQPKIAAWQWASIRSFSMSRWPLEARHWDGSPIGIA